MPVLGGAVHVTSRPVVEFAVALTVGAPGAVGGSSTSDTVMVTATVSVPPLPSSAFTVTE